MVPCKKSAPHPDCPWGGRDPSVTDCSHNYTVKCPGDKAFLASPEAIAWLVTFVEDHKKAPVVGHPPTQRIINRLFPLAVLAHAAGVKGKVP